MTKCARGPALAVLSGAASLAFVWAVSGGWLDQQRVLVVDDLAQLGAASLAAVACVRRCPTPPRTSP
jgi:hypothetical protein